MSQVLPRLRLGLDIMPSPIAEKPGLLIRDPFRYSDRVLIIPSFLTLGLRFFDGESTDLDLQAYLSKVAGQIIPSEIVESLVGVLRESGFLVGEEFRAMQAERHAEFAAARERAPVHAGSGYSDEAEDLRRELDGYLAEHRRPASKHPQGLAAPHVSPWGGWQTYGAAYGRLAANAEDSTGKTVVILGTSHYGQPESFGLTRKAFVTPFGLIETDQAMVDWLAERASRSIVMEDYCHAIEHSIEFQCIFLQRMLGAGFKILPILCGPFAEALTTGTPPEDDDRVDRFLATLGELGELHGDKLLWVLGVDLAHIGRRYADEEAARAEEGLMLEVKEQDLMRIDYLCRGETEQFLEAVVREQDPLKWCGFSPLYTFLKAVPQARGNLLRYEQWNIDEESVVSFAALEFV